MIHIEELHVAGCSLGRGDGATWRPRKGMGISYMKRLAASKAPWPSWEFKQEQAMKRAVDCYGHLTESLMLSTTCADIVFLVQGAAGCLFFW